MACYGNLLALCAKALASYDSEYSEVDTHLEEFLSLNNNDITNDAEWTFISEVVTGCVRYKVLIKVVVDGFYAKEGRTCLKADYNLFGALSYIIMFRLEEIGMGSFKKLIYSQNIRKMHKFLSYLFNKKNLNGWISDEWCRVYDHNFVKYNIILPMLRFCSDMNEFIGQLSKKLTDKCTTEIPATTKKVTEVKPFNLTKPKYRSIPADVEEIPVMKPVNPVPKTTYKRPVEQEKLLKAFQSNRKKAENNLLEAERVQFSCASAEKSQKTQEIMKQIILEKESRLKVNPVKANPVPSSILMESQPVKLNAAAIYREGARILREEKDLQKKLAHLEAGEGDATEFYRWQDEMKQKESAEEVAEIKRKHMEGQLSFEEAIISKRQCIQNTREAAQKFREESQELMRQYFSQRKEEQLQMRRLVEATMNGYKNTQDARDKLTNMKQKIVQQVAKESQELMARALEEEEKNMKKKTKLIQQIRAMECVPVVRTDFVDFTETSGQGFLSEMSIAELHERLSLMKIANEEQQIEKRKAIKNAKQAKEQYLNDTLENISRHREEKLKQSIAKAGDQQKTFNTHHANLKAQKLNDMQEKLENRRKERQRLQHLSTQVLVPNTHTKPSRSAELNSATKPMPLRPVTIPVSTMTTLTRAANRT